MSCHVFPFLFHVITMKQKLQYVHPSIPRHRKVFDELSGLPQALGYQGPTPFSDCNPTEPPKDTGKNDTGPTVHNSGVPESTFAEGLSNRLGSMVCAV